jgi:hypothetical protein
MQIKITMKDCLLLVRVTIIKYTKDNKRWQGCTEKELDTLWLEKQIGTVTAENDMKVCKSKFSLLWQNSWQKHLKGGKDLFWLIVSV